MKEEKIVKEKVFIKSRNGVDLTVEDYISGEGYDKGHHNYEVYETKKGDNEGYVSSCRYSSSLGGMFDSCFDKIESFKEYCDIWKKRFVLPNFRPSHHQEKNKNGYMIDLYQHKDISKDGFIEIIRNINFLLENKCAVHYNDEHGVGYFNKKGKIYVATHNRWGNSRTEKITIEGIAKFLREFFDLGYRYDKKNVWGTLRLPRDVKPEIITPKER